MEDIPVGGGKLIMGPKQNSPIVADEAAVLFEIWLPDLGSNQGHTD